MVRRAAAAPVQKALYQRLSTDEELIAVAPGYDHVPEDAVYPYWTVGEAVESPDNTLDTFGAVVLAGVHVWSDYKGFVEPNTIGGLIVARLDRQHRVLDVEGHRVVAVRFQQMQPVKDPDPKIRHVIVRFQVVTEQKD